MSKGQSDAEALMTLSNILIDLVTDKRIPLAIRQDYSNEINKTFPAVVLLSYDYIESKGLKLKNRGDQ